MKRGIGELWHRRITRTAGANPHAAVRLEDVSRAVQMMFRAGGGDARVRVVPATPQRIGGPRASLGALDGETLALPPVLAVFDQPVLNRDLYLWLAALGACHDGESADWIGANLRATRRALARFPGLRAHRLRIEGRGRLLSMGRRRAGERKGDQRCGGAVHGSPVSCLVDDTG